MSRGSFPLRFRKSNSFFSNRNIYRNYVRKMYENGVLVGRGRRLNDIKKYHFWELYGTTKGKRRGRAYFGPGHGPSDNRNPWMKSTDI